MSKPFFSILILFWQSDQYLQRCLQSLETQTFQDFEVILLDNGASQPPDTVIMAGFQDLRITQLHSETNLGFAGGNNLAARSAVGEYLVLLNSDAFPEQDWLEVLHTQALLHPNHFFASRLKMADQPGYLDGEWNEVHCSGLVLRRNYGQPLNKAYKTRRLVLSACAAACAYPKLAFDTVGGFDEDFFAYMEDIDLDFRIQLAGWRCLYLPNAVVHHVGSGSTKTQSGFGIYYGQRNLIWAFFKNMPGWLFWLLLPLHVTINLFYLLASVFMDEGNILRRAKKDAFKRLPVIWQKRKAIQSQRKASIWYIVRLLNWNPLFPIVKIFAHKPRIKDQND